MRDSSPISRMIDNETTNKDSRLNHALRVLIERELIDPIEAIAIARTIRLVQRNRDDNETQIAVGTFFIANLDTLDQRRQDA